MRLLVQCCACLTLGVVCYAQTPLFEATVTPSNEPEGRSSYNLTASTLSLRNQTLKDAIGIAYEIKSPQIVSGAKWMQTDRYDIEIRTKRQMSDRDMSVVLQNVLKERFKLDVHRETRMVPGYALVPAKGGMKIHEIEPGPGNIRTRRGNITAERASIANLTAALSEMLKVPVLDETGASGVYTFAIDWTADLSPPGSLTAEDTETPPTVLPENSPGPSLFAALQEQLGLRLESRKAQLSVMVVDRASRPK